MYWGTHTPFLMLEDCSWRRVEMEVWGGASLFFLPRSCFPDSSGTLAPSQRLGYAAGSLGTELEATAPQDTIQVLCVHAPAAISERRSQWITTGRTGYVGLWKNSTALSCPNQPQPNHATAKRRFCQIPSCTAEVLGKGILYSEV